MSHRTRKKKSIAISPKGEVKFFCANCQEKIRFKKPDNLLKHVISHGRDLGEEEKILLEKANRIIKKHLKYLKFSEWSTPLHQQDIDQEKLQSILEQDLGLKVKITSTNSGFLLDCPKCQTPNKLFYNFEGKQFLCLNYQDCGFKPFNLTKLKTEIKKTKRPKKG